MTDKTDWKRVRALTEAEIAQAASDDPDSFVPDADWMAKANLVMPRTQKIVTMRVDSYQPAQVLTHEEWVNAGRYQSLFGAPPAANPARNTNPP